MTERVIEKFGYNDKALLLETYDAKYLILVII